MPKVKCPVHPCEYETEDLDSNVVAALITAHSEVHKHTVTLPKKVEIVKRPSVSADGSSTEWSYFITRWNDDVESTKINDTEPSIHDVELNETKDSESTIQSLECCDENMRHDLTRAKCDSLTTKAKEDRNLTSTNGDSLTTKAKEDRNLTRANSDSLTTKAKEDRNLTRANGDSLTTKAKEDRNLTRANGDSLTTKAKEDRNLPRVNSSSLTTKAKENVLAAIGEENTKLARFNLYTMIRRRNETIRSFGARLKKQATICKFVLDCGNCNQEMNFTGDVLRDVLIRGLTDSGIQLALLGNKNQDMDLEQVFQFVEEKESGTRSASKLMDSLGTGTASSSYWRNKSLNHVRSHNTPKPQTIDTCLYCGKTGHGVRAPAKKRKRQCEAYGKTCSKCKLLHHFSSLCGSTMPHDKKPTTDHDESAVFDSLSVAMEFESKNEQKVANLDHHVNNEMTDVGNAKSSESKSDTSISILNSDEDKTMELEYESTLSNEVTIDTLLISEELKTMEPAYEHSQDGVKEDMLLNSGEHEIMEPDYENLPENEVEEDMSLISDEQKTKEPDNESTQDGEVKQDMLLISDEQTKIENKYESSHHDDEVEQDMLPISVKYKTTEPDNESTQDGEVRNKMLLNSGSRSYICGMCGKAFKTCGCLKCHLKTHTGERAYKCAVCGSAFTSNTDLTKHTRIHTGEKRFKCDICDRAFVLFHQLKLHRRIHTGDKPYQCDVCGSTFARKDHVKIHRRTHTGEKPYKCDVCGSTFTQCSSLISHRRIHTGERPHKCNVCGFAFTCKSTMRKHMRIHTGEKPYKCDICGSAFSRSGNLKAHKRTHTRGK